MVTYPKDWTEKTFEQFIKIKRGASPRPIEAYLTKSHNGVNWIKIGDASKGRDELDDQIENVLMPICVGLKLVLRLTEKVFDKSDNKLNYYNDPDKSYIRIMEFMPGLSIQDFNTILEKQGLAPLGTVSKDEK